jgi:CRISPR-associated protein Cmr3
MRLFIEPTEPLMFRDGRPFEAGQNNFAQSLFPPTPETLQGAVRAAIAASWDPNKNIAAAFKDTELTKRIGDRDGYGRFRMTGIALGRYDKDDSKTVGRLLPPPAHIMKSDKRLVRLRPDEKKSIRSNLPAGIDHYLVPTVTLDDGEDLEPIKGWLPETSLRRTLFPGDLKDIEIVRNHDIYQEESRLGIGVQSSTKATAEGYLYQMQMIRMNHLMDHKYRYGFVVDITLRPEKPGQPPLNDDEIQKELHLDSSGWMTLGGEQRTAHFRVLPSPILEQTARSAGGRPLLYLATPASFQTGWKPSQQFAPLDAPITAAINRYDSIGGWLLSEGGARGENKAMRRCVPAGSVYFYDKKVTPDQSLTDNGMEIGYGIIYEGEW